MVDAISSPPISPDETRDYFATTTRNLLAAEERAGVRHHVLLSIVGIHRIEGGTAHYSGKREQERLIEAGPGAVDDCASHAISRLCGVGC